MPRSVWISAGLALGVDLAAKEPDEDLEIVVGDVAIAPHLLDQPVTRHDAPRGAHEAFQDRELRAREA